MLAPCPLPPLAGSSLIEVNAHSPPCRYPAGSSLVEVNAHSLFSRFFSESGKLVGRLFSRISELVEVHPRVQGSLLTPPSHLDPLLVPD